VVACLLAVTLATAACTLSGVAFREDGRVRIVEPGYRATVALPFEVRWTVAEALQREMASGRPGSPAAFAVFVDKDPQPPGEPLSYFARDDAGCASMPGCPDAAYLANEGVYVTKEPVFTVSAVSERGDGRGFHEVSIVLVDDKGARVGQPVWNVSVEVEVPGS
jgi:hypothetical protein